MTFQELSNYNDSYLLQEGPFGRNLARTAAALGIAGAGAGGAYNYYNQNQDNQRPAPPAVTQPAARPYKIDPIMDARFIGYIKNVENAAQTGRSGGVWFPHKSYEGGTDTIGYGHKIKAGEDFSKGLSDEQVNNLLIQDLRVHEDVVKNEIGTDVYTNLDINRKQMLIDFAFNLGTLKGFPKFTQGVIDNNIQVMQDEYPRYSGGQLLKRRNDIFYNTFLNK